MSFGIDAPAKVNLSLEVLDLLPGGYHELDTVFTTLELADRLEWKPAATTRLHIEGDTGGMPVSAGEDNLVLRALRLLEEACGRALPLELRLQKRIPAGGGLGGGSSDAAALLFGVNESENLGLSRPELQALGAKIGADVAFCVEAGTARGTGRGERLAPLPPPPSLPVVLLFPPFGCPTGEVYRAWDRSRPRPARGCSERVVGALNASDPAALLEALGNDLQPAAEEVRPELVELNAAMGAQGAEHTLLSGSGSTMLAFVRDEAGAEALTARLQAGGHRALRSRLHGRPR